MRYDDVLNAMTFMPDNKVGDLLKKKLDVYIYVYVCDAWPAMPPPHMHTIPMSYYYLLCIIYRSVNGTIKIIVNMQLFTIFVNISAHMKRKEHAQSKYLNSFLMYAQYFLSI